MINCPAQTIRTTQEGVVRQPIRVLQIVENLNSGSVENWLYRMFATASLSHPDYHWTFFCTLGKPGRLDDQVRALGGKILYSPYKMGDKRAFFSHMRNVMKEGNYDILHCHHDFVSAIYLWAALGLPIRKRIVHVHNTDEGLLTPSRVKQFILKEPMRQTCLRLADNIIGVSRQSLAKFIRNECSQNKRDRVVYCDIDTSHFHDLTCTREEFRLTLGFSGDTKIMLFVGRMTPLKNPMFVVEVLAELVKTDESIVAVFAGAGELECCIKNLAEKKGISDKVRILGWRDDTATLMRLSDVLLFPRLEEPKEGLGLVLVEAQAAGLPIVASPSITEDVQVIAELFDIVPLAAGAGAWAKAVFRSLSRADISRDNCLGRIASSPFSTHHAWNSLLALYSELG